MKFVFLIPYTHNPATDGLSTDNTQWMGAYKPLFKGLFTVIGVSKEDSKQSKSIRRSKFHATLQSNYTELVSSIEAQKRNDAEWRKLVTSLSYVEILKRNFADAESVLPLINRLHKELEEATREFYDHYWDQYGKDPPNGFPVNVQHKYESNELATVYMKYLSDFQRTSANQLELADYSNISQSTWSRAFGKKEFWISVNMKLEFLWNAHSIADDRLERIKARKRKDERVFDDALRNRGLEDAPFSKGTNEAETILIDQIDERVKLGGLSTKELVKRILKSDPSIKKSELEKMSRQQLVELLSLAIE